MHLLLLSPWGLLALVPVAAVAYWSLRRLAPRVLNVATLWLWQRAIQSTGQSPAARGRPTLAWLLTLLACLVLVLAISQPVLVYSSPARRIAIEIVPSFELAETPQPFAPVLALLDRLDPADRVCLLLPEEFGGATAYLSLDEARRKVATLNVLPQAAGDIAMPEPGDCSQEMFRFAPVPLPPQPGVTDVALPPTRPPVHIDALAARCAEAAKTEVFLRLANSTDKPRAVTATILCADSSPVAMELSLPPAGFSQKTITLSGRPAYIAALIDPPSVFAARYLAVSAEPKIRLALLGRQDANLRRYAQADSSVDLVADAATADAVIAVGIDQEELGRLSQRADIPALLIDAPQPPAGVVDLGPGPAASLTHAALSEDSILHGADVSRTTLRSYRRWQLRPEDQHYHAVLSLDGSPLLLVSRQRPRAYLAFDIAAWNTNLALAEPAFPILLHNILRHLCPASSDAVRYMSHALEPAYQNRRPLSPEAFSLPDRFPFVPGIYADNSGGYLAANMPTLEARIPASAPAGHTASRIDLCIPQPIARNVRLWPPFVAAAAVILSLLFLRRAFWRTARGKSPLPEAAG